MAGKSFRAPGARVTVDEAGIDCYRWWQGGTRVAWEEVSALQVNEYGEGGRRRRSVVLTLSDGSPLILPAPRERRGGPDEFDAAWHAISDARRAAALAAAEPHDAIPPEYLAAAGPPIASYGGPARRTETVVRSVRFGFAVLALGLVAGVVGLCGSVHAFTRDQPAYDSFRNPVACSAYDAASGLVPGGYCRVADGIVDDVTQDAHGHVDGLIVGPLPDASDIDGVDDWSDTPTQYAYFPKGLPGISADDVGTDVEYVSQKSGDVASLIWKGVTYQTASSPQSQRAADLASLCASSAWTLLCGLWFAFRLRRRRRYTVPRVYALFTCGVAVVVGAITAGSGAGAGPDIAPGMVFVQVGALAPMGGALLTAVLVRILRRRGRPLLFRRRRARP